MAEIIVTERWSDSTLGSQATDPTRIMPGQPLRIWTGHRGFDVTGVTTKLQALQAAGVPQDNDSHPEEATALVCRREATMTGPISWYVSVDYQTPPGGEWPVGNQPLGAIVSISWYEAGSMEPYPLDVAGNPIVNSARDPFDPHPPLFIPMKGLRIIRNEAFYNQSISWQFENTVNLQTVTFMGRYSFSAGTLLCNSIIPAADYTPTSTYVPIAYTFTEDKRGWRYKTVDRGMNAYNASGNKEQILDERGAPMSVDQFLNGKGGKYGGPNQHPDGTPAGAVVVDNGQFWSISYAQYEFTNFGDMGL